MKTLFLLALATAIMSWGATGSLFHSHLCGWGCMPLLHPAVCRQVGVAHPFHPSLLLGDVLSRLCGWSCTDLLLCPVRALRLYLLRARSLSTGRHRLFVSPRRPARPSLRTRCRSFWGEVIAAARAARPPVGSLRAHEVRSVSTSVAFHRHWSVPSVPDQPLGPPVRCFLHFLFATFNTNLMVYFLLVTSWLRVLG